MCVSAFDRSSFRKWNCFEDQYWHTVCTRTHTHTRTHTLFTPAVSSVSWQSFLQLCGFSFQPSRWWTFRMKADPKSFWISINPAVSGTVLHGAQVSRHWLSLYCSATRPQSLPSPLLRTYVQSVCTAFKSHIRSTLRAEKKLTVAPVAPQQIPSNPAGCLCALFSHILAQYVAPLLCAYRKCCEELISLVFPCLFVPRTCSSSSCTSQPSSPSPPPGVFLCDRMSRIYFSARAWTL